MDLGKKGMMRLSEKVRVGDRVHEPGMYHVQHVVEGSDHIVTFKPVTMPAGYKEYSMVEGREIVRLNCRVESVAQYEDQAGPKRGGRASNRGDSGPRREGKTRLLIGGVSIEEQNHDLARQHWSVEVAPGDVGVTKSS